MGIPLSRSADALDRLFARTTGASRLGLERTAALLDALGNPHLSFATVHVAGTNGKGSTVATIDALLRAPGRRVGRYTSPHLVDFRERIAVDGVPIADDAVGEFLDRWMPAVERTGATFFEATTAMAFHWFAEAGVDIAVIETGLGGRLDATNVVRPLAAAVTSIGIDHTEFLGATIDEIAKEKAGIFKRGAAALIGESDGGVRALLRGCAREAGATPIAALDDEWTVSEIETGPDGTSFTIGGPVSDVGMTTPLFGAHQARNAALGIATVHALGEPWWRSWTDAAAALLRVSLPGRFQRVGKIIYDVAHNPDGAATLARTLRVVEPRRPVVVVLAVLRDKDWRGMMRELAGVADSFVLTSAPTAPASRAWDPAEALALARDAGWPAEIIGDFDEAIAAAIERGETVVVTGSFHTVGDAMARLRVSPFAG